MDTIGGNSSQATVTVGKRFWSYIRSQRKDQISIPGLEDGDKEVSNSGRKAEILCRQYESLLYLSVSTRVVFGRASYFTVRPANFKVVLFPRVRLTSEI